jgi:LysM repeat protein
MVKKYNTFEPQLVIAERNESAVVLTNEAKLSLYKKSQKSGISTDILEEVYRRGHVIWNESFGQTAEQFAFDRVNSFIAGGFALNLDDDLLEGKRGLWDNIHAKRKRIKAGSGERMRKPGSEGAPTDAAIKASQNEEADPCWDGYKQVGMKKKKGREVPNCVPVKENAEAHSKDKNKPSSRFVGSNELVDVYKKDTPGQSTLKTVKKAVKENLDEQSTTRFDQNWSSIQRGIRGVESGSTRGNYTIPKPRGLPGTASGAYAFTDKTWRDQLRLQGRAEDLKKYPRAHLAPPEIQDQVFKTKTRTNYIKQGGDENPQALRRTLNIHYTGNPAGNMTEKQLRANRGTTSDAYWRKFQGLSKQDSPSEQPRTTTPTSSASSSVAKKLSAAPPPVPRPADLDKAPETPKTPETPRASTHTVARGQTAAGIASQHGMTLKQLRAANPQFRGNLNTIQPGQQFNINPRSSGNRTPEAPKPETPKVPDVPKSEAPKSSTSGAVIADPNKDFGSQVGAWMQNWVDGQMRARQQRQQPEAPRAPSARTRTPSSDGMLSPEPMKTPQGSDMTLGSQRTFRATDDSVSDQQKKDVEKIKREQESGNYLTTSGSRYGRTPLSTSDLSPEQNTRRQERDRAKERGGQWEADFDQRMYRDWPLGPVQKSKNEETLSTIKRVINEATHKGRKVTLNKPFRTPGGPKKSAVYVDPDGDGKAKIVRFGDPNLSIKKDQPARKRSYCARSSGQGNLTKKDSANYWSRRAWDC